MRKLFPILCLLFIIGCGYTPKPNVEIICFGDSSTAGAVDPSYPSILAGLMGIEEQKIDNAGNSGETTKEGLDRLQELITFGIYPNATTFIYWEGGNDITDFVMSVDPLLLFSPNDPGYMFTAQLSAELSRIKNNFQAAIQMAVDQGWNVYIADYYPLLENGIATLPCPASPINIITEMQAKRVNEYGAFLNTTIGEVATNNASVTLIPVSSTGGVLQLDVTRWHNCNHLNAIGNQVVAEKVKEIVSP